MEPQEWQRLASEIATEVGDALDQLETEFWPQPSDPSFRRFWPRIRSLSERLRTAPAIDIEDKLRLLSRIRHLTRRAREDQEIYFVEQRHRKQETMERIAECRDQALASSVPSQVRGLRQELIALRDGFAQLDLPTRSDRQEVWHNWQSAGQEIWDRLNQLWSTNEESLEQLLNQAQTHLDKGIVREARESIRRFNARCREVEVSHKAERTLRARANALWRDADELAKTKHEAFVSTAPERVGRWKQARGRNAQAIDRIRSEIDQLARASTETGVAAAFAKAMIEEKTKELDRLESTNDSLEERIEDTEAALSGVS